jgi:hypothetical protein
LLRWGARDNLYLERISPWVHDQNIHLAAIRFECIGVIKE